MEKDTIIFDLDGTLANCDHRRHFVENCVKNWPAFFAACDKDTINEPVVAMLDAIAKMERHYIIIVTGRATIQETHNVELLTKAWLLANRIPYDEIYFRTPGDYREDSIVKKEILDKYIDKKRVLFVVDDRNSTVKMWREQGLPCFQVAEGNF